MATIQKKVALVTGGAGFIGSHLCERLLQEDRKVICLDNFLTSDVSNIQTLLQNPEFQFIKWDINEPLKLEMFPELASWQIDVLGIQEIYHLACPTSAKKFDHLRVQTLLANSVGMRNILDIAVKFKSRFMHASTSVVYGARQAGKDRFVETDLGVGNHLSPRGCYDEGKKYAETACATYAAVFGLDVRIARIFRTYGPKQRLNDGEMIPDFVVDALEGRDLVIYGDEKFTTSLLYVSDLVDGLVKYMRLPKNPGPMNFGSDQDNTLETVAKMVIKMTNSKSQVVFEPPLLFMTQLGLPDTRKASEELSWIPLVRLEDGLKKSIEYAIVTKGLARSL
jgi:UDP-glucuronate decarboxylase